MDRNKVLETIKDFNKNTTIEIEKYDKKTSEPYYETVPTWFNPYELSASLNTKFEILETFIKDSGDKELILHFDIFIEKHINRLYRTAIESKNNALILEIENNKFKTLSKKDKLPEINFILNYKEDDEITYEEKDE